MEVGPIPVPAAAAPADVPYIHSPSAAHEPPVRNMSMSTASTSGSVELAARQGGESEAASSSTFAGAQVGLALIPKEGEAIASCQPSEAD